jgi:hypothetical protein
MVGLLVASTSDHAVDVGGCGVSSSPDDVMVRLVRQDVDRSVLAVSGDLSMRSASPIGKWLWKSLVDTERVLIDGLGYD